MKHFINAGRVFYAIAIIVYGIQQFIYGNFRNVLFPPWQFQLPLLPVWAYIFGIFLIGSGVAIMFLRNARNIVLLLGGVLLFLFCFLQVPYELISEPNKSYHFGLWVNALKEFALTGGAFVIAGTFQANSSAASGTNFMRFLEKIIPYGNIFFCIYYGKLRGQPFYIHGICKPISAVVGA